MELKDDQWDSLYVFAKTLEDKHVNFSEIEKQLTTKTDDAFLIKEIMTQIKKVHYAVKRKQGFVKLGFGSIFLLAGFFITCFSSSMVGLMFVFWGLYEIIG